MYTLAVTAIVLFPIVLLRHEKFANKKSLKFFAIYGCVGALLQLAGFGGIVLGIPVAIVSLLMYTQPIYTTIFGRIFYNEKITKNKTIALIIAILGVIILLQPWNISSSLNPIGTISALFGGVFLSLWVVGGRKAGINKEKTTLTTFSYAFFTVLWLILIFPIFKFLVPAPQFSMITPNHPITFWIYVIVIALISRVLSNFLFYLGLENVSASKTGIVMLVEPISAAALSAIFFSQPITIYIILGGFFILLANYITIKGSKSPKHEI
jgi:drug/metabolite transporter (DMT)-like permease